jgi:hypothetical protein
MSSTTKSLLLSHLMDSFNSESSGDVHVIVRDDNIAFFHCHAIVLQQVPVLASKLSAAQYNGTKRTLELHDISIANAERLLRSLYELPATTPATVEDAFGLLAQTKQFECWPRVSHLLLLLKHRDALKAADGKPQSDAALAMLLEFYAECGVAVDEPTHAELVRMLRHGKEQLSAASVKKYLRECVKGDEQALQAATAWLCSSTQKQARTDAQMVVDALPKHRLSDEAYALLSSDVQCDPLLLWYALRQARLRVVKRARSHRARGHGQVRGESRV